MAGRVFAGSDLPGACEAAEGKGTGHGQGCLSPELGTVVGVVGGDPAGNWQVGDQVIALACPQLHLCLQGLALMLAVI